MNNWWQKSQFSLEDQSLAKYFILLSNQKYSIIEFNGFNEIQNTAHELGHILGAVHDGTFFSGIDAKSCPASRNNIMAPSVGSSNDAKAMYSFSDCSIEAFKNTLLTPDRQ